MDAGTYTVRYYEVPRLATESTLLQCTETRPRCYAIKSKEYAEGEANFQHREREVNDDGSAATVKISIR